MEEQIIGLFLYDYLSKFKYSLLFFSKSEIVKQNLKQCFIKIKNLNTKLKN